jgi:ssDNA thymidine ADP-ribosyltransferase DarT-like protein
MERKPDAAAIATFFDDLARQPWLGGERRRWPDFLFHITDVRNAASILHTGRLLSRARALAAGVMANDQAEPSIIGSPPADFSDHARLYFRPRTPTMFCNEGIRPAGDPVYGGAHCPVPVALLFDARLVAGMAGVIFSDRSVAYENCRIGGDAAFLRSLVFQDIYALSPSVTRPKHAEVLVPGELPLHALRHVYVRTAAERQTLLTLIDDAGGMDDGLDRSRAAVRVDAHAALFFRRWTYVETAQALGDFVDLRFNPSTLTPGPFVAETTWESCARRGKTTVPHSGLMARGTVRFEIPSAIQGDAFRLRLTLNGSLAFYGRLDPAEDVLF